MPPACWRPDRRSLPCSPAPSKRRLALALGDEHAQQLPLAAAANELYKRVGAGGRWWRRACKARVPAAPVPVPLTRLLLAAAASCVWAPKLTAALLRSPRLPATGAGCGLL